MASSELNKKTFIIKDIELKTKGSNLFNEITKEIWLTHKNKKLK